MVDWSSSVGGSAGTAWRLWPVMAGLAGVHAHVRRSRPSQRLDRTHSRHHHGRPRVRRITVGGDPRRGEASCRVTCARAPVDGGRGRQGQLRPSGPPFPGPLLRGGPSRWRSAPGEPGATAPGFRGDGRPGRDAARQRGALRAHRVGRPLRGSFARGPVEPFLAAEATGHWATLNRLIMGPNTDVVRGLLSGQAGVAIHFGNVTAFLGEDRPGTTVNPGFRAPSLSGPRRAHSTASSGCSAAASGSFHRHLHRCLRRGPGRFPGRRRELEPAAEVELALVGRGEETSANADSGEIDVRPGDLPSVSGGDLHSAAGSAPSCETRRGTSPLGLGPTMAAAFASL